jgi:alkyl hydroperoxide reductase subunit F
MLDQDLKDQLSAYLERVSMPIELVASLDDSDKSDDLQILLEELAALSPHIRINRAGQNPRKPSFEIRRVGTEVGVHFAAIPLGHEFTSLVLALLQVGGNAPRMDPDLADQVRQLDGDYQFETFMSLSCHSCPDTVQALNAMSVLNPRIRHIAIDGAIFRDEVADRQIMAVPTVFLNGQVFDSGRMTVEQIVSRLDSQADKRKAEKLSAKAPFDVLVVGGGPAGAAAAVYAARKGIRTGVLAERFGGQVQDTVGIENLISVRHTEGPKLSAALEEHVRDYDVDIMVQQRAQTLVPASTPGGLHQVQLANGAVLHARSIILSTGARWRDMNVPGEQEYRNKGVTYCPHCDGPLFKGKKVAVIGGGNSGIEAAIDLAGIVEHVTVLEFDGRLRADEVLQRKLHSLPNVTVITSAQTTEVYGDGQKLDGLRYTDRTNGTQHDLSLSGVFVQIGLVPNSDWLKGVVGMTPRGEIEVDRHGSTSVPGVFAAGDVTNSAYKQIIIAMGDGATASLGAFDYLIRLPTPETATQTRAA